MRTQGFIREVWRNLTSGTTRLGILFLVSGVALCAVLLSDLLTIARTVDDAIQYRDSGAAITTIALPGRINGESCEALAEVPDVLAAGAMRESGKVASLTLPGEPLALYVTTPHFGQVLGARDRGIGVYASADVARSVAQPAVPVEGSLVPIRGTYSYPPDGRRAGFGWALLAPTAVNDGVFDECWALSWPQRSDLRQLMLAVVTPTAGAAAGEEPLVSQLNTKYGAQFSGTIDYANRVTRFATPASLAVATLLGALAVWFRRVEIASNLHLGGRRTALYLQQVIEVLSWSLPAFALAWVVGTFTSAIVAPSEVLSLGIRTLEIALAFLAGSLFGATLGFALVREERLWRYVKGR